MDWRTRIANDIAEKKDMKMSKLAENRFVFCFSRKKIFQIEANVKTCDC